MICRIQYIGGTWFRAMQAAQVAFAVCIAIAWANAVATPDALADVVWIKGEAAPGYGTVVEQSDQEIVFQPFGQTVTGNVEIPKASIELLVINIDRPRLERLDPRNPEAYRDYAEELATQKVDPAARELAVRLYLIAAYLTQGEPGQLELQQSCLTGLLALAENDRQAEKWKMLRLLNDPAASWEPEETQNFLPVTETERKLALQVVRMIRQGNGIEAAGLIEQPATASALSRWSSICSLDELKRIGMLNRLTTSQLHLLLKIELSILQNSEPGRVESDRQRRWSEYAMSRSTIAGAITGYKTATRFNPEESTYRNGVWVKPN